MNEKNETLVKICLIVFLVCFFGFFVSNILYQYILIPIFFIGSFVSVLILSLNSISTTKMTKSVVLEKDYKQCEYYDAKTNKCTRPKTSKKKK